MFVKLKSGNSVHNKLIFIFCFFAALTVFTVLFIAVLVKFKPVFEEKADCAAQNRANLMLNTAISSVFQNRETDDIVCITSKENSDIAAINMDTVKLNKLKSEMYREISKYIKSMADTTIYIPIGSLTDYPVLQGVGYKIPVKLIFDTAIEIDFTDNLKEAGINQVYYEIFMVVTANVDVVSSLMTTSKKVKTEIPISQNLIVGNVPSSYGGTKIVQ